MWNSLFTAGESGSDGGVILRDEEYRKELLKHIAASKRSYGEIIAFLDGNADGQP